MLENKKILVTGGTGSFGSFVVNRLIQLNTGEVRVLSRDEKKQYDMRTFYSGKDSLKFVLGDIRDIGVVDEAMEGVDIVIQAAALKQVPNCEFFPMEVIRTNILGVQNVIKCALKHRVETMVSISTDKAVKPVNVMGMTKALQERITLIANLCEQNKGTLFSCVRYGNVLQSRGSVVPLFRSQLKQGKKLTITDTAMTRFLLSLEDAIELVLFAAQAKTGGNIFVKKVPSASIMDIAAAVCEEAGRKLEYDIVGRYPGEKLHEILISEDEVERAESYASYYQIHPWWSKNKRRDILQEYSSKDELVSRSAVRDLLNRSDAEFRKQEITETEFSKF